MEKESEKDYISINQEFYFIDIDAITDFINIKCKGDRNIVTETVNGDGTTVKVTQTDNTKTETYDLAKYEMVRQMIDVVFSFEGDPEEAEAGNNELQKTDIGYRLAFNTLLKYNILRKAY